MEKDKIKLIALYFTQLHSIPENDEWWGKGFTDWVNVKKAQSQFDGHYQPRIPLNSNYYDQSKVETIKWQVNLAKKYGIYGFCHYHYWFNGKQLLETPTNLMLDNSDVDFPFCLSWANETWSKRWDGRDHDILIKQTHPGTKKSWQEHFDYLIRAWSDERAIKIDGKPIFIIYRPQRIRKLEKMLEFWRSQALKAGIKGIYVIYQSQYDIPKKNLKGIDAIFRFQPFNAIFSDNKTNIILSKLYKLVKIMPGPIQNLAHAARDNISTGITFNSYDAIWQKIINQPSSTDITTYKGAFVDWDNTARYGERARVFTGVSPQRFTYWFSKLVNTVLKDSNKEKLIFINAWNEWAESAYLEPDSIYKYQYLEAIQKIMNSNE